jgi:pimeloyl-ACP methyl ester carboxylesterase
MNARDDSDVSYRGGRGEPLVLLHGAAMSWRAWRPVLRELERFHDVYVPTMAGHRGGLALGPGVDASVAALVDALCDELDEVGIDTAHVAGNSLGGWVALELARRGRARSVVALSPAGGWSRAFELQRLVWLFRLGLALGSTQVARRLVHIGSLRRLLLWPAMEHGERVPVGDLDDMLDDLVGCGVIDELLRRAASHGPLGPLADTPCPVRIAWSEHDHVVPWRWYGIPFRAAVPDAEFVRLPAVGHLPMWDDPELVSRVILQVTAWPQPAPRSVAG